MRIRKPSPSMAVSIAALVMASTGSAVAAVSYATNSGAVDGKSAVSAGSSVKHARGRLVATKSSGTAAGKIPNKFLANVSKVTTFAPALQVNDNAAGAPVELASEPIAKLTTSCNDQNNKAGVEDPSTTLTLSNPTASTVNFSRQRGTDPAVVGSLAPGTVHTFTITGSNVFHIRVQLSVTQVAFEGFVRQDGRGTSAASCVTVGQADLITP